METEAAQNISLGNDDQLKVDQNGEVPDIIENDAEIVQYDELVQANEIDPPCNDINVNENDEKSDKQNEIVIEDTDSIDKTAACDSNGAKYFDENDALEQEEVANQVEVVDIEKEGDQTGELSEEVQEMPDPGLDAKKTQGKQIESSKDDDDEGPEEGEDLEDGEIDDDDEEVTEAVIEPTSYSRESRKSRQSGSRDHDDDDDEGSDGERRSSRHGNRKHKSERRKERSKRDLEKELKSDEEKKRLLKEKLRALELQMGQVDDDEEDDVDDEEMGIYVAGGSPIHSRKRMMGSDDSDAGSSGSGGSPSIKRRRHGDKHDRHQRSSDRDHEQNVRPRNSRQIEKLAEICPLFMQGKCPKNAQTCHYSHDADPPKIMELCKFYLFERCAKKEKCLYLHKGFPCKYYHTGHRCLDTAETCKFSHEPLTDITRPILLKHLESAPKEILGDFPRFTREAAAALVFKTEAKHKGWDNFDDEMPDHLRNQTRSAADSFIENSNRQQQQHHDQGPYFGGGMDNGERRKRPSRWGDQANSNFRPNLPQQNGPFMGGPGGPMGGHGGPMGGPGMRMGGHSGPQMSSGGPLSTRPGKGLLGEAPRALMSLPIAPPAALLPTPSFPPGYDDGNMGEDQIKDFLKAQREALLGAVNVLEKKRGQPQLQPQDAFNNAGGSMFGSESNPFRKDYPLSDSSSEPLFKKLKEGKTSPKERTSLDVDMKDEPESLEPLPQTQQRLFERIQQKQRDSTSDEMADTKNGDAGAVTPREDNWYSSDEEKAKPDKPGRKKRWDVPAPLGQDEKPAIDPPAVVMPQISLPKELADVLSSIKKEPVKEALKEKVPEEADTKTKAPSRDPRMNRDPRYARMQDPKPSEQQKEPKQPPQQQPFRQPDPLPVDDAEKEKEKRILEMDLSIFGALELPAFKETEPEDDEEEDRMGLPFKPHRVQPVAKEIDASIYSHPVLEYKLHTLELTKPDYSNLVASMNSSRVQQDPRLKRYAKKRPLPLEPTVAAATALEPKSSPASTGNERPSDPRRKNLAPTSQSSPSSNMDLPKQQQVYNPKNDLYASKPRQDDYDYPHKGPQQEVYSPSQDVQDMYGSYNRPGRPNDPRNYDPRDEMGPNRGVRQNNYDEDWNDRQGGQFGNGNNRNWGPQQGGPDNWGGPNNNHPDQGYYDGPQGGGGPGFYDHYDGYGASNRGAMMVMGGPPNRGGQVRSVDPRTQGRDPRRR